MQRHLIILVLATRCLVAAAQKVEEHKAKPPENHPLDTKSLVEIAVRQQIPMPPKDAKLVLAHTGSWQVVGGRSSSRDPGVFAPAFLLEEHADGSITILRGLEKLTIQKHRDGVPWHPFSTEEVKPALGGYVPSFSRISTFVCAVQVAARGDEETAQQLWNCFLRGGWRGGDEEVKSSERRLEDPLELFPQAIFDHYKRALLEEGADRKTIFTRMTALLDEFQFLNEGGNKTLLEDLKKTVDAPAAKPGSVEALVLAYGDKPDDLVHLGLFGREHTGGETAREVVLRGLEAMPELVTLLEDRRITTHVQPAVMMAPSRVLRVKDIALYLAGEIAGLKNPSIPDVLEWWDKVKGQDEESVLAAACFRRDNHGKIEWVNDVPAQILARKHPQRLAKLLDEFARDAKDKTQPYSLAEAIAQSALPLEQRVKLLVDFSKKGSLEHQRCTLQWLARIDGDACAELLPAILEKFPDDVNEAYWTCPQAPFSHVVMEIERDDIWIAYLRLARRSSVGLRMEMMNPMDYSYIKTKNRERRLAFLAAFLDDESVRDRSKNPEKYDGPCAAFTIPKIQVRNFVAEEIALILEMQEAPNELWTDEQWDVLRAKVKARLAEEKLPDFKDGN